MKNLLFAFNCLNNELRQGSLGECAPLATIEALIQALQSTGHQVWPINVESPTQLRNYLNSIPRPSLAFVYAEGFLGMPETLWDGSGPSLIREILGNFNIPTSHSTPEVMQLCRHKNLTATRLQDYGLPVPHYQLINPRDFNPASLPPDLKYPLFVKPASGGASLGIDENSLVRNLAELTDKLRALQQELGNLPVIVETYLPGQEYTVGVLGNETKYILPPVAFDPETGIRHQRCKRNYLLNKWTVLDANDHRWGKIASLAFATFDALKASDVIRIDLKEDEEGNIYIIDVNGTPSLGMNGSLVSMAQHLDISQAQLVGLVLDKSYQRYGIEPPSALLELTADALQKLVSYASMVA